MKLFCIYCIFIDETRYGLKVECGASSNKYKSTTPDACFFFADNLVAIDHDNGDVYILSIHDIHSGRSNDKSWLIEAERRLLRLSTIGSKRINLKEQRLSSSSVPNKGSFVVEKSKNQYIKDVEKCLKLIRDGESYELCLTTQMRKRVGNINALKLYFNLREQNPAPYAAWLNFAKENLCICCSSPERFLRLDKSGTLEAKPIKGTIARGRTREEDERLRLQLQYRQACILCFRLFAVFSCRDKNAFLSCRISEKCKLYLGSQLDSPGLLIVSQLGPYPS